MNQALSLIAEAKRTHATRLDLSNCGLTHLPDELFELTDLEELVLSDEWWEYDFEKKEWRKFISNNKGESNHFQKLSPKICSLSKLKKIAISNQEEFSDLTSLKGLANLQQLYIPNTQVSDLAPLEGLTNLQLLYISSTQVRDLTPLRSLVNLQQFYAFSTQISDLTPLQDLVNLQKISVYSTQVRDLIPLIKLVNLQVLTVSESQVSDLIPLKDLSNLQQLYAYSTQISDLTPLKDLKNLQLLSIFKTHVNDLMPLKDLSNLQQLYAYSTQISDLTPLKDLSNLKTLSVSETQVSDLTPLKDLSNLQQLYAYSTEISDLTPLKDLSNLQQLDANETQVSDLTPLKDLANLKILSVSETQVSDLTPLKDLSNLKRIFVYSTQVSDLTPVKNLIIKGLSVKWESISSGQDVGIFVKDCPLDRGLIAAIKKGQKAVIQYFEKPTVPLYEARVLILGEPRAGKTTLRRKLKSTNAPMPTTLESTKAFEVEIDPYKCLIEKDGEKKQMTYHLWDFGGQDYYRLLHQLFVSEQSVYVIVTDTDRNKNEEELDFWLETIYRLGKDKNGKYGPVLLLQNPKTNREGSDFLDLKKRYSFWQQNERFVINLDALSQEGEGKKKFKAEELAQFKRFKTTLEGSFCHLDHVGKQMPKDWVKVRKALNQYEQDNWIRIEDFYKICAERGGIRDREEQTDLLDIFHTLGYVQHYKNTALQGMVILKREWVTDALYRVLDDAIVKKNKGWFRQEDAKAIWFEPQYDNRTRELLALMQEFKLSYLNESSKKYIVPAKLPEDIDGLPEWDSVQNVSLHLQYDWLPRAVPIQLIVTLHDNLVDLPNDEQWIWRRGAVLDGRKLDLKDVQVRIVENWRENKIEISARGIYSEVLIRTIMAAWRKVNEPFESKVNVQKQILCACEKCQKVPRPFVFEYEDVLNAIEAKGSLQCNKSRTPFPAASILRGLFDASTITLDIFEKQGHNLSENIKNLISEGKLEQALDELGEGDWTIDLKRRFAQLKQSHLRNQIAYDEYSRGQSQIVNNLLAYLGDKSSRNEMFHVNQNGFSKLGRAERFEFNPTISINLHNENKNVNVSKTDSSQSTEISELKQLLLQLNTETQTKLKDFVETLPEPENEAEKLSTGKQILRWLNKNAEGIIENVAASAYYDGLKFLLGIG